MVTFLFWNIGNRRLNEIICRLVARHDVDMLMLTECAMEPYEVLETLNESIEPAFHFAPGIGCQQVKIFCRFDPQFLRPIYESDRLTIRRLNLPGLIDILIAVTHLPSKLYWSDASQAFGCVELARSIQVAEQKVEHSRTVLVGDLNMNPFEDGIVSANGLHGVMTRIIARRNSRTVQGREYPFFYNPMWSLLGDASTGPPGTYYYGSSEQRVFFWNMFDQVLVRPSLMECFDPDGLAILDTDGQATLLGGDGVPDARVASDHLPLLFRLSL